MIVKLRHNIKEISESDYSGKLSFYPSKKFGLNSKTHIRVLANRIVKDLKEFARDVGEVK